LGRQALRTGYQKPCDEVSLSGDSHPQFFLQR
jgi:hypothetical protein